MTSNDDPTMRFDAGDRLEIHELAARYGNSIDDRDWDALSRVFTDDARYVIQWPDGSEERYDGFAEIETLMATSDSHPVAHHVTNIVVEPETHDRARLAFKVVGPGRRGRVGTATYHDVVVRTPAGWRIREHIASVRPPKPLNTTS